MANKKAKSKVKVAKKATKKVAVKATLKSGKVKGTTLRFPANLLAPVGKFLQDRLKYFEKRKALIEEEDPFEDNERLLDNASPDADAAEQFGHARVQAIRAQMDRSIIQVRKALSRIKIGKYGICESCGKMIDTARLEIYPEATLCMECEAKKEKRKKRN